jgi:hypothetical protein
MLCWSPIFSSACDLCSMYLGINPNDFQNSFGLVNRLRVFESTRENTTYYTTSYARLNHVSTPTSGERTEIERFKEVYITYDLWARIFVHERWQLNFSASFSDNYQYYNDEVTNNVSGVGDVVAVAKHLLLNSKSSMDSLKFRHRLVAGGGIKFPTGSFKKKGMTDEVDHHLQSGTGSLDYLLLLEYLIRYQKTGFSGNVVYRINSENSNAFRFANRFSYDLSLFQLFDNHRLKWMPSVGIAFESSERDQYNNERVLGSGGEALFLTYGVKFFYQKVSLGITYFGKPIHEDLYDAPLQLNNTYRTISNLVYYF